MKHHDEETIDIETSIGDAIRATEYNSEYDECCKRVLAEKAIIARILKGSAKEWQDSDVKDIEERFIEGTPQAGTESLMPQIKGNNTEDTVLGEGTTRFDVFFTALAPNLQELIEAYVNIDVNLEAQKEVPSKYPLVKRGFFHTSRMISRQHGQHFDGKDYSGIRKVYSIWIVMNAPKKMQNTINRYTITEENVVGNYQEKPENYDLMTVVMIHLGKDRGEDSEGLLRMLGVLLGNEIDQSEKKRVLEEEFDIKMTETIEKEVSLMCNLSQGIEEKARRKTREEERKKAEKALKEERKKRIKEREADIISCLKELPQLGTTKESAISYISKSFHLTQEEATTYVQAHYPNN